MFTGIVEAVGRVAECHRAAAGMRIGVDVRELDLSDVAVGESIALAGCCLTVVQMAPPLCHFDVSDETLRCTTGFAIDRRVNLEKALRLSDRLGGHLVSGHVDGVAHVTALEALHGEHEGHRRVEVELPVGLARYVASKGSIAVDGVSLTTNTIRGTRFTVNLIPHTLDVTTLGTLAPGDAVNIEVDIIARYVERLRISYQLTADS
jgi:riboflavin synthase